MTNGAQLISTGTGALVQLNGTAVEGTAALSMSNSSITLAGPLATVINLVDPPILFDELGDRPALFDLDASSITSTGTAPLITFSASQADPDGQFMRLANGSAVSLAGPLLSANISEFYPGGGLLAIGHSSLSSTTTSPLIDLTSSIVHMGGSGSTSFGRFLSLFTDAGSPLSSSVSLAGPFLSATSSDLTATQIIGIFGGATFTSTSTSPLISLNGTSLDLFTQTFGGFTDHGDVVAVGGSGSAPFPTMSLKGPLLSVSNGSSIHSTGGLALVFGGGKIIEEHPTSGFVTITGGSHAIASDTGTALFRLFGRTAATTGEVVSTTGLNTPTSSLTLGTDEPLKRTGSGGLLEASGATINTRAVLTLDSALLQATAPILSMKSSASLTSSGDALNLTANAKLTATGPLVKLDGATLNVTNGHAFRALNGSFMNLGGDLLSILNGGTLNVSAGGVLFVGGGSVVKINGALVNFINSSGTINETTNRCGGSCSTAGGLNFVLQNGALAANITVSGAIKNAGSGTLNQGLNNAVIILNGSDSKVIISGN